MEKLKWFNHAIFLEVLALCQCMPGPTSTQVSFAMGTFKQGTLGERPAPPHLASPLPPRTPLLLCRGTH